MTFKDFESLESELNRLLQEDQVAEALELVTRQGPNFPADRIWVDYWRMYTAASLGKVQLVLKVAEQSLADGLWYGESMWRGLPSFEDIRSHPGYERVAADSRAAEMRDAPNDARTLITRLPQDHSGASPLLVALHGNNQMASQTLPFWRAAVSKGWALALPQSTQALYKGAYGWNDFDTAHSDVKTQLSNLSQDLDYDPNRVTLAGHSMGGLVAVKMALMGSANVRGFVALGPAVPFLDAPEELETLLEPARQRGVRGYFILGEKDTAIFADKIHTLSEKLKDAGIACELETVPGASHDDSSAYETALLRALDFVDT